MPVDPATDFLWQATGHATATTSVVVTHPDVGGTTAGKTVIVAMRSAGLVNMTPPAGWVRDKVQGTEGIIAFRLDDVAAGETSWTFTRSTSGNTAWWMVESDHLSLYESFEVATAGTSGTNATGTTRSTGTTALNAGSKGVAIAVFGSTKAGTGDTHSWASYTNSYVEQADFNPAGVAGQCIAVAAKAFEGQGTFETTATFTTSTGTPSTAAAILVYRADDGDINAPLAYCTGFEFGTAAGMANTSNSPLGNPTVFAAPGGTFNTNYRVIAGAARTGGYGLEVANTASANAVPLPTLSASTIVFSGSVKHVSGTGTLEVFAINVGGPILMYDATTSKFGLKWTGTTEWQTGTTPSGTHAYVEIRAKMNSSVHHAEWWIETGTGDGSQTSPADLTGMGVLTALNPHLGPLNSQTGTFHYDDVVYSRYYAAYPLGPHAVQILVPETTGASVSGTAANFNEFTANGTLAAFASTSGQRIDEVPPTISASSDGVVQVTLAASDYMNFPMTTLTLDPNEIIAGVRALAALWGGTGTGTGTLGFRGHDGLTETTFVAASTSFDPDSLTTASATYPLWYAAMWSGAANGAWTPTRLAAAALRGGFSTDATPDMGFSAMYLEVATRKAPLYRVATVEEGVMTADLYVHPYSSAAVSYAITNNDPTRTATFNYSIAGTPQTPVTVAPGAGPVTLQLNADAFGDISATTLTA